MQSQTIKYIKIKKMHIDDLIESCKKVIKIIQSKNRRSRFFFIKIYEKGKKN